MLTNAYKNAGIPLREAFGVDYPEYFTHPAAEYHALRSAAGVIDLSHWTILRLTGRDRVTFLHAMVTNDVSSLAPNTGCHATLTTIKGKIIAELYAVVRKDDVLLFVSQGNAAEVQSVLEKHIIMEDVQVENISAHYGVLAIEGPLAGDVLWRRLFPSGPFPRDALQAVPRAFETIDCLIIKNSVTGEEGYHTMVPAAHLERLRTLLVQASRGSDGLPVGSVAWNIRRTEAGLPWYDVDFGEDNFPQESRLDATVSYTKGCFRGQETLARLHHRGHVNRHLIGLAPETRMEGDAHKALVEAFLTPMNPYDETALRRAAKEFVPRLDQSARFPRDAALYDAEDTTDPEHKPIGRLTTCVFSPALGQPLCLGYVRTETVERGGRVFLESSSGPVTLTRVDLPVEK